MGYGSVSESFEIGSLCSRVACKSSQPALELLVLMRTGPTWRHVQSLFEREEMFKWPYHLPPLFRNLALVEHPNSGDLSTQCSHFSSQKAIVSVF